MYRRIDYHTSAYQIPTFNKTNWYTGEAAYRRRPATGESPFQISTFNTTDWYTGESAYTDESITILRRIRFQRPTQQISTPANHRTQATRLPSFGVSDSNVQHNRLVHRRSGVPATGDRRPASRRIRFQRSTQQIGTPANRRTRANRLPSFGVSDFNVQNNRLVHRRSGVPATGESPYQIPTFNTTDWYTGKSAYTGESITILRRIRFQRPKQQIGTPAKRRTGDRRVAVSDSNVQHNRLVHRQIGVPATGESPYQIPTFNTTDWHTGEAAYRRVASRCIRFQRPTQQIGTPARRRTGDRRSATGDRRPATGDR